MDGNGRWAEGRGLSRLAGHREGAQALKKIVRACPQMQVGTLSLFAFSQANWKRDKVEVDGLWDLLREQLSIHLNELVAEGVRLRVLGDREGIPPDVVKVINDLETRSETGMNLLLNIALNYDGLDEVVRAINTTLSTGTGFNSPAFPSQLVSNLDTGPSRPVDILIRTGMPQAKDGMSIWRSSGFLPLQSVEAVCVSLETLWPDMTPLKLSEVIAYADPESRLFGGQRLAKS